MESVWPVSKLSIESVGSRRELVANSCTHRRRDATKQFRRVGVGGVYWALKHAALRSMSQTLAHQRQGCIYWGGAGEVGP